jgi:hypothetical protein
MKCHKCESLINEVAKFCGNCGEPVKPLPSKNSEAQKIGKTDETEKSNGLIQKLKNSNLQRIEKFKSLSYTDSKVYQIRFLLIVTFLAILVSPYARLQITLLGAGQTTKAFTISEPIFFLYVLTFAGALILNHNKLFLYNMGCIFIIVMLGLIRAYAAYSIEAGFGTTLSVEHLNVWAAVLGPIVSLIYTFNAYKRESNKTFLMTESDS